MKRSKRSIVITWLTCLSLVFSLCAGIILIDVAKAAPHREQDGSIRGRKKDRVASDLRQQMRKKAGRDTVKVIVQLNDRMSGPLKAPLKGNGVRVKRSFSSFNAWQSTKSVCVLVNENNRQAQKFYQRAGYKLRAIYDTISPN